MLAARCLSYYYRLFDECKKASRKEAGFLHAASGFLDEAISPLTKQKRQPKLRMEHGCGCPSETHLLGTAAKTLRVSNPRALDLDLAIARLGIRDQRAKQLARRLGDLFDR